MGGPLSHVAFPRCHASARRAREQGGQVRIMRAEPVAQIGKLRRCQVADQIIAHPRQMTKIGGLAVAPVQAAENAENAGRPLGTDNGIVTRETLRVEGRVKRQPAFRVTATSSASSARGMSIRASCASEATS